MSKIFYDHLIFFEEIEIELDKLNLGAEERHELERLVDEIVHHRVFDRILTHMPQKHHRQFLEAFHKAPHDPKLLDFLNERIEESVQKHIQDEAKKLKKELLEDIRATKKK